MDEVKEEKKLKYICFVCEVCPFEDFVILETDGSEPEEIYANRFKAHIRSLTYSAAQEEYSIKLCRKHQEQLQAYLIENHGDMINEK